MKISAKISVLMLAILGAVASTGSRATTATDTSTLTVTATVENTCAISDGTLAFNNVKLAVNAGLGTLGTTNDMNGSGDISVVCTSGASAAITAGGGSNFDVTRKMASGSNRLAYELYTDSQRETVLNASTGNIPVEGTGEVAQVTIYGKIFGESIATAPAGNYSDSVALTITYTP